MNCWWCVHLVTSQLAGNCAPEKERSKNVGRILAPPEPRRRRDSLPCKQPTFWLHQSIDLCTVTFLELPFGKQPVASRTRPRAVLWVGAAASRAMVESNTLVQRYDLLPTMSKYLDPQLVFALTEFIRTRDIYDGREVLAAQVKLLWSTNMVEFTMDLYKELHGPDSAPQELEDRKDAVIQRIGQLQEAAQKMIDVISNQSNVQGLRSDRTMNSAYLKVCKGLRVVQLHVCSASLRTRSLGIDYNGLHAA